MPEIREVNPDKRFIESPLFPFTEISEKSQVEQSMGGKPPHYLMAYWWARRPLMSARAVVAASLLPEDVSPDVFRREVLRLDASVPHRVNPSVPDGLREYFRGARLLDPFAGYGSIPLEALRLGVGEVVALDLLPVPYVYLNAVLSIPKWLAERGLLNEFIRDLRSAGEELVSRLRREPLLQGLYDPGVDAYIGTWEVRCPVCHRYTPLFKDYRLYDRGGRRVFLHPVVRGDRVVFRISSEPPGIEPNVSPRAGKARCLLCGTQMPPVNEKGDPRPRGRRLPGERLLFYPKWAIRRWNELLEKYLGGFKSLDELRRAPARPRIVVRVSLRGGQPVFSPATGEDDEKLWLALERLRKLANDPDLPREPVPSYDHHLLAGWGFDKWYKMFNPRQLLLHLAVVKHIRGIVAETVSRKQLGPEDRKQYAKALATYLALAFIKHVDYNSVLTSINASWGSITRTLASRGMTVTFGWVEQSPWSGFTGSLRENVDRAADGVKYLGHRLSGSGRVRVVRENATVFRDSEGFDVVVTDPPYRDNIPYAELSDYFYVWLRRLLRKYYPEAFGTATQHKHYAVHEISLNKARGENDEKRYRELLQQAFRNMARLVKPGGLVVTYFVHSSPEAWEELVAAGLSAGLRVTAAWPIRTEYVHRRTAQGRTSLDSSIVVVWRRRGTVQARSYAEVYREARSEAEELFNQLKNQKISAIDSFVAVMARVLGVFTRYKVFTGSGEVGAKSIVRAAYRIALEVISGVPDNAQLSPEALLYLAIKKLYGRLRTKSGAIELSDTDAKNLGYGVGMTPRDMLRARIIVENKGGSKKYRLAEPLGQGQEGLRKNLLARCVDPDTLKITCRRGTFNAVDAAQVLEYAVTGHRVRAVAEVLAEKGPRAYVEGVDLLKYMCELLGDDPERELACRVLEVLRAQSF